VEAVHEAVEPGGEEAGFEAGGAEHGLLAESHALDGKQFLGIDGLVEGNEVGAKVLDFTDVLQADDGVGGGSERMGAERWLHRRWAPFLRFEGREPFWGPGAGDIGLPALELYHIEGTGIRGRIR